MPPVGEPVPDNMSELSARVRSYLQALKSDQLPVTYQALAAAMELSPPNTIRQISTALETLMAEDAAAAQPFIATLVVSKGRSGIPAIGFYDCARKLGRYQGSDNGADARAFHKSEYERAIEDRLK